MLLSFKDYSRASGLFTVEHTGRSHHLPFAQAFCRPYAQVRPPGSISS